MHGESQFPQVLPPPTLALTPTRPLSDLTNHVTPQGTQHGTPILLPELELKLKHLRHHTQTIHSTSNWLLKTHGGSHSHQELLLPTHALTPTRPLSDLTNPATPPVTQHGTPILPQELDPKLPPWLDHTQIIPSTEHLGDIDAISQKSREDII